MTTGETVATKSLPARAGSSEESNARGMAPLELGNKVLALGIITWLAWIARLVIHGGRASESEPPLGWDLLSFRAAAKILVDGDAPYLYDADRQVRAAQSLFAGDYEFYGWAYPPHFAVLMRPTLFGPHFLVFAVVTALNVALLVGAMHLLRAPRVSSLYALCAYPVAFGLLAGQNCVLTLFLVAALARSLEDGRAFRAGLCAGAMMYKPQLVAPFVLMFWCLRGARVRALTGFAAGSFASAALAVVVAPAACVAWIQKLPTINSFSASFRPSFAFTVRGFFNVLLPRWHALSDALALVTSLAALVLFVHWARRQQGKPLLACAGAVWTCLAFTPHAAVYEWTMLLVPLVLLRGRIDTGAWTSIAVVLFVGCYASGYVVEWTTSMFGCGIQLAAPALFYAGWRAVRALEHVPTLRLHAPAVVPGVRGRDASDLCPESRV